MKKFLSFVTSVVLVATMLPLTLVQFDMVPAVSAAACTISTDTTVDQSYIDTNSCQTITVDTSSVITFSGNLNLDDTGTFTVNESVTATLSGTGIFTDSNDSIVINGTLTHADENTNGVALSASGNVTISSTGSINVNEKGCTGAPNNSTDGEGPALGSGVCTTSTSGYGDTIGVGASYGGLGGVDSYNDAGGTGTMYGDSANPIYLGSGGGGGNDSFDGGDGGGRVYLNIDGTLDIDGVITADAEDGDSQAIEGASYGGGGGSGGSILIHTGTLSGDGSIGANGGHGGDGNSHDGGGGGGGRVAVYYDTLSGFDLSNIEAAKGLRGGGSGGNDAEDGLNGSTFILDMKTDNGMGNLRINSGLDFQDGGDYSRNTLTIAEDAMLQCADNITTLTIYADSGNVNFPNWYCRSTITTMNFIAAGGNIAMTGTSIVFGGGSIDTLNLTANNTISASNIDWIDSQTLHINMTADTWSDTGSNTMAFNKTSQHVLWEITNDLVLENLTYNTVGGNQDGSGSVFEINNAINVDLVNTDINSSVNWTNLSSLDIDSDSTINADYKGCAGGWEANGNDDGAGPNTTTGICAIRTSGYGYADAGGGSGGGHGGAGGRGYHDVPGATYDTEAAPVLLGSGGGAGNPGPPGGAGGGKIRIQVDGALTVAGSITANGEDGIDAGMGTGGGSGGSVYLDVTTLAGTGSVSANGGDGGTDTSYAGGGGGGGRIAVVYGTDSSTFFAGMTTANSTTGGADGGPGGAEAGSNGTLYSLQNMILDSVTITDNSGYTTDSTPVITLATSGATATGVSFSCDNTNWSDPWVTYPDDDVINDGDGPTFNLTEGITGCTSTEELKTAYIKVSGGGVESSVGSDTTTFDITPPTVSNVTASNANDTYGVDDIITVQIVFDEEITKAGTPQIELDFDGTDRTVDCTTLATDTLSCPYTIVSGDNTSDLGYTSTGALTLNGGALGDLAGSTATLTLATPGDANSLSANKAIVVSTNQTPTAADLTVSQASAPVSGVNIVNVIFDADDADDDDTVQAKVEYNVGTGWAAASIVSESITATTGTPVVDNDQTYQIGQASGYIETSSGVNTITSGWASSLNVTGVDTSSAQVRVTPYDGIAAGTAVTSSAFVLDQVAPTGGFTETYTTAINETSVAIGWDPVTTETNFAQYTVYYKRTSTDTYSSAGTLTTMSTSASSITGLTAGVQYDVYVQAADSYGNTTNSPVLTFTTSQEGEGTTSSNTVSQAGGGSSSSSSTSTSTSDSTTTDTGDSDQNAGEGETGEEDYTPPSDTVEEPSDSTTEDTSVEEPVVEIPVEEVVIEEPAVEEEPEDYISEPLHESPEEDSEETAEEPLTVGVFDGGDVKQEVYEDEIVISYYKSTDEGQTDTPTKEIKIDISITKDIEIRGVDRFFTTLPAWSVIPADEIEEIRREKEEAKEELVNSIIDYVEIIKDDPEVTKEEVEEIKESIEIMEELLEDDDNDGILDEWEEITFEDTDTDGTADTDGDGLTDMEEYQFGSDPMDADTDNDGLSDLVEISIGTDPDSWDSDKDGKADTEELFNDEDPLTATTEEVDAVLYDEDNDTDGDGLSDYIEELYNTDPYSADSDGDGITDTEEIEYDTNPTEADYIEELDTKITNIPEETSFAGGSATFKGTSTPDTKATIYIIGEDGAQSVIITETDEKGKFSVTTEDLPDGEYELLVVSTDDSNDIKDLSKVTIFTIDSTQEVEPIEILELGEEEVTEGKLGSETRFSITRPKLSGYTKPGYILYVTWKSVVLTSVVVADTQTGAFTATPPDDLAAEEDHTVYVYAVDPETNTVSETVQVNFTIGETSFLHESAAQREADERTFPYATLILLALVAMGGAFIVFKRGKLQQSEEKELLKKL